MFFNQIQLHGELVDLAFERRNVGLVLRDDAGLCLFIVQLTTIELRKPQLDEVGRNAISALCIAPSNDAVPDILAKLQFERRRMPTIWTSGLHEPSSIEARRVYQFFRDPWSSPKGSLQNRLSSAWKPTRAIPWPENHQDSFFWCGCEYATFREVRRHLRETVKLPKSRQVAFSHWRRGLSNDEIISAGGDVVSD